MATTVGISDMKIVRVEGTLITYALGSCVGVCLYDPAIKLAAMIHIMLPTAPGRIDNVFKYADTGVSETLRKMEIFGAMRRRMVAKIAGGAKMFNIPGDSEFGNIGNRNIEAVKSMLQKEGICLQSIDVGGNIARTLSFDAANGIATVKTFGRADRAL